MSFRNYESLIKQLRSLGEFLDTQSLVAKSVLGKHCFQKDFLVIKPPRNCSWDGTVVYGKGNY